MSNLIATEQVRKRISSGWISFASPLLRPKAGARKTSDGSSPESTTRHEKEFRSAAIAGTPQPATDPAAGHPAGVPL